MEPRHIQGINQRVVKSAVYQNSRQENDSVRERVHPSLEQLGGLVTALGVRLAGLDLIASEIGVRRGKRRSLMKMN